MYSVKIHTNAFKSLKKFPLKDQIKINKVKERLKVNPFVLDIKKLGAPHKSSHRLRVGEYRIFLEIDTTTKTILIVDIERRTSQTYH